MEALRLENHHLKESRRQSRELEGDDYGEGGASSLSSSSASRRWRIAAVTAARKEMEAKLEALRRENEAMAKTIETLEKEKRFGEEAERRSAAAGDSGEERETPRRSHVDDPVEAEERERSEERRKAEEESRWRRLVEENRAMASYIRQFEEQILHSDEEERGHGSDSNDNDNNNSNGHNGNHDGRPWERGRRQSQGTTISSSLNGNVGEDGEQEEEKQQRSQESTARLPLPSPRDSSDSQRRSQPPSHRDSPPPPPSSSSTSSTLVSFSDFPSSTNTSLQSAARFEAKLEAHIHQLKSLAVETVEKYATVQSR